MGVVREIEQQNLTLEAVRRKYGIQGNTTVLKWMRKYGPESRGQRIRVERTDEINQLEQFKKRVRALESALADANIDLALERAYTRLACERIGVEVDEFKKKAIGQRLTKR